MEHNGVYPYLTMQGYYDGKSGEIISLAIARTADIFDCIKSGEYWINQTRDDKVGQSEFYVVDWDAFKNKGYKIAIYDNYKQ